MIQTVLKHGAIYVQPDYRLLPEANGEEVLEEVLEETNLIRNCPKKRSRDENRTQDLGASTGRGYR